MNNERVITMKKFQILATFLISFSFLTPESMYAEAKTHHKKAKKKRPFKQAKNTYKGATQYTKKEPLLCDETCNLPGGCTFPNGNITPAAPGNTNPTPTQTPQSSDVSAQQPQTPVAAQQPAAPQSLNVAPVPLTPTEDHPQEEQKTSGFYVGLGSSVYQLSGTYALSANSTNNATIGFSKNGLSNTSLGIDLNLGYLQKMGNWGLGIEGYFDPTSLTAKNQLNLDGNSQTYSLKLGQTIAATTKLGYFAGNKTFIYTRIGYERQKMKVSFVGSNGMENISANKNVAGLAIGFGARYMMGKHWAIGGEYVYGSYKKTTFKSSSQRTVTTVTPANHALRLTLAYVF